MDKKKSSFFKFLVVLFCLTSSIFLQRLHLNQLASTQNKDRLQEEESLKAIITLQKQSPDLGFNNLIADWNYLQFIQYFGDVEEREKTSYSLITDYFEVLVEKDPRFIQAYLSLSSANSLFAARPDKTVALINKVLESISPEMTGYPFLLWTYKATDEILFLGDLKAAQNSYETAAEWADQRGDKLGAKMANRYHQTAQFLASNPDSTQTQISAWVMALNNARDEKTRDYALEKLEDLGAKISITKEGELKITMPSQV